MGDESELRRSGRERKPAKRQKTTQQMADECAALYMGRREDFGGRAQKAGVMQAMQEYAEKEPRFTGRGCYNRLSEKIRQLKKQAGISLEKRAAPGSQRNSLPISPADEPRQLRQRLAPPEKALPARELSVEAVLPEEAKRLAIAVFYIEELNAPPKSEWTEHKGTVYDIYSHFSWLSQNNHDTILMVLTDVNWCAAHGVEYDGKRKQDKPRCRALLQIGTEEANITARAMERHLGLRIAHRMVSLYRESKGAEPVGISAVYGLHLALKPVVTAIEASKQGKTDVESHWALA